LVLACLMLGDGVVWAQAKPGLRIVVVEGEGAINNIQLGVAREPVVEVRDENDRAVAGAKVTFTAPKQGPGGTFFGASPTLTSATDDNGRAVATGFRPNAEEGRFQIQVIAVIGDRTATAVITQSNALPGGGVNRAGGKKGFGAGRIIAIVAAAAAIGIIAGTRGDNEAPAAPTTTPGTTITPGTVSVGVPR
jgi:hypothetical protein